MKIYITTENFHNAYKILQVFLTRINMQKIFIVIDSVMQIASETFKKTWKRFCL